MDKDARVPRCPICGKPAVHEARPFCSRRCKDVDLSRWLSGSYMVAGGDSDADEDGDDRAVAGSVGSGPGIGPGAGRSPGSDSEDDL